jgi:hypothetical protein
MSRGAAPNDRRRVPAEYVGRARVLRQRIARAAIADEDATFCFLKPLVPRSGWPSPGNPLWLEAHALAYRALPLPTRLAIIAGVRDDGGLRVGEIRVKASRMAFADRAAELAVAVTMRMITTAPFQDSTQLISDVGLHALARRFERARPNDDAAVLRDLKALADGYRSAVANGGDFEVPTKAGGRWIGCITAVRVLGVRTFLE